MRVYNFVLIIIFPLIFFRSLYKSLKFGENPKRIMEKFSFYGGKKSSKPVILIHAVSVGEVLASRKFVEEIRKRFNIVTDGDIEEVEMETQQQTNYRRRGED